MRNFIITLLISTCFTTLSTAQGHLFDVNWKISTPVGSTTDYVNKTTGRGVEVNWKCLFSDRFALGLNLGWSGYNTKQSHQNLERPLNPNVTATITANHFNLMYTAPVVAMADYYFTGIDNPLRPFVSLGIGTTYIEQTRYVGLYDAQVSKWGFTLAPAAGLSYQFPESTIGINAKISYVKTFATGLFANDPTVLNYTFGVTFFPF